MKELTSFLIGGGIGCVFIFIFRKNFRNARRAIAKTVKNFFGKGND